jgi:hypothetical protein
MATDCILRIIKREMNVAEAPLNTATSSPSIDVDVGVESSSSIDVDVGVESSSSIDIDVGASGDPDGATGCGGDGLLSSNLY